MKTIQKTIKKLTLITLAASFAVNLQAEGYYAYFKALAVPRYEACMKTATSALQTAQSKALEADKQVTEYATEKQPWFKDHLNVLTGIKIGAALTTIAATCWTLKKTYNKLQGLRQNKPVIAPVMQQAQQEEQCQQISVKARVAAYEKSGVKYGAKEVAQKTAVVHQERQETTTSFKKVKSPKKHAKTIKKFLAPINEEK